MIEWEKMSNFAAGIKATRPLQPRLAYTPIRVKQEHDRSVPPPFQVRFKSVPYIEDICPTIGSLQDSSAGY